jgi:PAS domain S-box-containing protein
VSDSNLSTNIMKIKILHVDDDETCLTTSKLMLLEFDSNLIIDSCPSVDQAIEMLKTGHYDAILSDYEMPQKTGLDFLRILREQKNNIPFILFTGKGREEVAIQALNLGADGYQHKQGSPETVFGELLHRLLTIVSYSKAKNSLFESEEKFRKAFQTIPDAVLLTTITGGTILDANNQFVDVFGYSKQDSIGKTTLGLGLYCTPSDRQTVMDQLKKDGYVRDSRINWCRKNGEVFPGLLSISLLHINNQDLTLAVIKDLSLLRQKEESLKKSEASWAATLSSVGDAVIATDIEGNITFMNQVAEQLTGWKLKEAKGKPLNKVFYIINETTGKTVENPVAKVLRTGLVVGLANHTILVRKDGSKMPIDDSGAPILDENNKTLGVVLIFRDIAERRKMEKELTDSEKRFRSLFHSMTEGACLHQVVYASNGKAVDYVILEVNPAYENIIGIKRKDAVGKKASILYGVNEPPYLKEYEKVARTGKSYHFETYFAPMEKHFEISVFSPETGKFATVFNDITERKKVSSALNTTNEKLRVIGSLVRHDVSNKLSGISTNAYLLRKNLGDNPQLLQYLNNIDSELRAAHRLFELSSLYENIGVEQQHEIDVENCFAEAVKLVPNLKINVVNNTHGLKVTADSLLKQVFYNFIDNSLRHGEKVTEVSLSYHVKAGETLLVYSDDGMGVSEVNKPRLFTEGFTTAKGTGLGLAMIRKILQTYGWTIRETGVYGKGVKFEITIPNTA